ncbi:MAG: hypothetical protein HRT73_05000 [Flavobacteriales bacterium]|nr:hypothetical protein [Flavobacteriales bacterium]
MYINTTLILKEIDQLDSAILQFSKNTLATKKICASILVGIVAIILKITNNQLDAAIYVSGLITTFVFWIIDSNSYYYQRKLRIRMTKIVEDLKTDKIITSGYGMSLNENESPSWGAAFFNSSQYFYLFTFIVVVLIALGDYFGGIK